MTAHGPMRILAAVFLLGGTALAQPQAASRASSNRNSSLSSPEQAEPGRDFSAIYLFECLSQLTQGKFSRGEDACTRALAFNPDDADALELRGYAYLMQHRFERAEADFRAALALRPDSAENLAGYGRSQTGLGNFAQAVIFLEKAVRLAPGNAAYRDALCWARAGTGKELRRALEDCNAALKLAPGSPGPLNSRGLVQLRMGRFAAAIADYTISLAARPRQPSARFGRGLAYLSLGHAATGSADILGARGMDAGIDSLFIQLGLLPRECVRGSQPPCLAGFPVVPAAPDYGQQNVVMKEAARPRPR